jgi:putative pyruvate formate lyase activating enzyme
VEVIGDKGILSDYFSVMSNKQLSRCKIASMMEAEDSNEEHILWEEHQSLRGEFKQFFNEKSRVDKVNVNKVNNRKPYFSYLDLKVKIAERMFRHCNLCEKACRVDRRRVTGECGVSDPVIASEFLHIGEELPLVPSHTVFFAGCNFNCLYCQNWDISQQPTRGISIGENLAKIIDKRRREGSRNVNFVGGDPTPNLPYILRTMRMVRENIPVVWNSNLYLSEEAMYLLDGFVDLYLTDFKYGNDDCAQRLSGVSDYMEVVGRNHQMARQAGDMIIRHLVLPNHVECCSKPLLKWISQNLGHEVMLNIMGQYHPVYQAHEHPDISRLPLYQELQEVVQFARDLGFVNLI